MWARVHKLDRVLSNPSGGAIILIEDERTGVQMQRAPGLSLLIAVARVLSARRALDAKFDGKGEIRYVSAASMPSDLSEAIIRSGASIAERNGTLVTQRAQPGGIAAQIDVAFSALAHHVRSSYGSADFGMALKQIEQKRRANPLDRDDKPELYWTAVLELASLAGEQSRSLGGRWIDTRDVPLPFALKLADGRIAHPTVVAQKIVEGGSDDETLASIDNAVDKPAAAAADLSVDGPADVSADTAGDVPVDAVDAAADVSADTSADQSAGTSDVKPTDKPDNGAA